MGSLVGGLVGSGIDAVGEGGGVGGDGGDGEVGEDLGEAGIYDAGGVAVKLAKVVGDDNG